MEEESKKGEKRERKKGKGMGKKGKKRWKSKIENSKRGKKGGRQGGREREGRKSDELKSWNSKPWKCITVDGKLSHFPIISMGRWDRHGPSCFPQSPCHRLTQLPNKKGPCSFFGSIFPKVVSNLTLNNLGDMVCSSPVCVNILLALVTVLRRYSSEMLAEPFQSVPGLLGTTAELQSPSMQVRPNSAMTVKGNLGLSQCPSCQPFFMERLLLKYAGCLYQEGPSTGLPVLCRLVVITGASLSFQTIIQDLSTMSPLDF